MNVEILRILYFIFCLPLLARTRCGNLEIFFWVKILEILQIGAIFFYKNPFYVSKSYFSGLKKGEICGDTKKKKKKEKTHWNLVGVHFKDYIFVTLSERTM